MQPLYLSQAAAERAAAAVIEARGMRGAKPVTRYSERLASDRTREHGWQAAVKLRHGQIVPIARLTAL